MKITKFVMSTNIWYNYRFKRWRGLLWRRYRKLSVYNNTVRYRQIVIFYICFLNIYFWRSRLLVSWFIFGATRSLANFVTLHHNVFIETILKSIVLHFIQCRRAICFFCHANFTYCCTRSSRNRRRADVNFFGYFSICISITERMKWIPCSKS